MTAKILGFHVNHFSNCVFLLQTAMIILFGTACKFSSNYYPNDEYQNSGPNGVNLDRTNSADYLRGWSEEPMSSFIFTHLLVLLGFSYLFVTSARYSWSSIGYTLLYVETVIQWAQLTAGFWENCYNTRVFTNETGWRPIPLTMSSLLNAVYIAATVQISLGACWGRISATQGLAIAFFETCWATANFKIAQEIRVNDAGGTGFIHVFGAAFGLACSFALSSKANPGISTTAPRSRAVGAFGLIGTLVLIITLPVFNATLNTFWILNGNRYVVQDEDVFYYDYNNSYDIWRSGYRSFFNTAMALASSTAGAFLASRAHGGKFSYANIQTAVLVGGIGVGAVSGMLANPWGAMMLGGVSGVVSVVASSAFPASKCGIYDAQGVVQNHLIPGLIGCAAAAIAAARVVTSEGYDIDSIQSVLFSENPVVYKQGWTPEDIIPQLRDPKTQGGYQMAFGAISLAFGLIGGALTGFFVNIPIFDPKNVTATEDSEEWDIAEEGAAAPKAAAAAEPTAA